MIFGERLKLLRNERNLTQEDIAEILNVGRPTIAGYETKGKEPNYDTLKKLADFFNVSIDYLLGRTDEKQNTEKSMPVIPEKFADPAAAREYVSKHEIFGANGFDPNKMTDDEILEFANALQEQMEMVMYKFKK